MSHPNTKLLILLGCIAVIMVAGRLFAGYIVRGMFVLFGAVATAAALSYFRNAVRPLHMRPTWWRASDAPHMSRLSLVVTTALLGCCAAWSFLHGLSTAQGKTLPLFIAMLTLIAMCPIMRWLDTGKWW